VNMNRGIVIVLLESNLSSIVSKIQDRSSSESKRPEINLTTLDVKFEHILTLILLTWRIR